MKIITTPDPRLRQKSTKVNHVDDEIRQIINEMIENSLEWEKDHEFEISAALAAPQLGYNRRIIIVRDDMENKKDGKFIPLLNPEVIKTEGKIIEDYEGCLSVPNYYGKVPRPFKARIKAQTLEGDEVRIKADGFLARTILHEIDHLDGILFVDHIRDKKDAFYRLDDKGDLVPVDYDKEIANNKDLFPDEED